MNPSPGKAVRTWPGTKRRLKLVLIWFGLAVLIAPIAYGIECAFGVVAARLVVDGNTDTASDVTRHAIAALLFDPLYAGAVVALFAVPYLAVLSLWRALVLVVPWLERSRIGLLLALTVLALPAGVLVANSRAGDRPASAEFATWFAMGCFTALVALITPRLVIRTLRRGAFLADAG